MPETKPTPFKQMNKIGIGFHGHSVTVESTTESLKEVTKTADELLMKILTGLVDPDVSKEERMRKLGMS